MARPDDKAGLDELARKLDALKLSDTPAPQRASGTALARAYRIGIELVVAVAVGSAIGYGLDSWLRTSPWLLILFFFLGVAAGFLNVYKAARKMEFEAPSKGGEPRDS